MNEEAKAARDAGIQQAANNAEEAHENWGAAADEALRVFIAAKRGTGKAFTSEEVRNSIAAAGVPTPPHLRAWGSVFVRAARAGLIEKAGTAQSKAVHCHLAYVARWRAV